MKCEQTQRFLADSPGLVVRVFLRLHLRGCPACRAEARQIGMLDGALRELPRLTPPPELLAKVLEVPALSTVTPCTKERTRMRKLAYVTVIVAVVGFIVGGALIVPKRSSGTSLLVQAAYAMGASDTLHVQGDRNLADEYSPWSSEPGSYEFWFSPEGFRQEWFNEDGALLRSLGGTVATGEAWQYFPGASSPVPPPASESGGSGSMDRKAGFYSPDESAATGVIFTYDLQPEQLSTYIRVSRERFSSGQLRVREIAERGHAWTEAAGEWQGKPVTVVVEELTPALVSGEERGTIEYYLDRQTGALVGIAQYGPEAKGRPLRASVDLIEYNSEIPQDVFQSAAPSGATAREGQYAVRPSGDIAFYPGQNTMTQSLLGSALEARHNATMGIAPWEQAEQEYLNVLKEDPENHEAGLHLGRMWTRWGLFQDALDVLPPGDGYWSDLNRAFCLDALGRRQDAVALYEKLKEAGHDSVAAWARLGLERPTWPHDLDVKPGPGEFNLKPRPEWRASASSSSAETTPQAALDGDRSVQWANGTEQAPGQWFQLDFGTRVEVSRIVLDHYGVKSFYTNNWPRGMKAVYTTDGTDWLPVDISQVGPMELATARFSPPMMVRTIRFELTQSHSPEWWSICELYVFSPTG